MGKKATAYLLVNILIIITIAAAILSVVCRQTLGINPNVCDSAFILSMLLPAILAVDFAAAVWWLCLRRWFVALIPIAAIAYNYQIITSFVNPKPSSEAQSPYNLKIATYNIHEFRQAETPFESAVANIVALAREHNVDILCMKEFKGDAAQYPMDSIVRAFDYMPYYARYKYVAIFSRYPIRESCGYEFNNQNVNAAVSADIDVDGKMIKVIAAHFQTTGLSSIFGYYKKYNISRPPYRDMYESLEVNTRRRAVQVDHIKRIADASPYPVVILGDWNDTPSSYTYTHLSTGMVDAFRECGRGYGSTYRAMKGLMRIDYIVHSPSLKGVRFYTIDSPLSDHKPLFFELDIDKQ